MDPKFLSTETLGIKESPRLKRLLLQVHTTISSFQNTLLDSSPAEETAEGSTMCKQFLDIRRLLWLSCSLGREHRPRLPLCLSTASVALPWSSPRQCFGSSLSDSEQFFSLLLIFSRLRNDIDSNPTNKPFGSVCGRAPPWEHARGLTWPVQSSFLGRWRSGRFSSCRLWTAHSQPLGWRTPLAARH